MGMESLGASAMSASPWGMALQAAPAVAGLLFGENSLFSGKARQASREMSKNFEAGQAAGINKGYYDVLAGQRARAQQGLGAATIGLAKQEQARGMNAAMAGMSNRRSALSSLPGLGISSSDFAMRLASSNEMAQRQNQGIADQTALSVAGLEDDNAQRKRDEAAAYWGGRKAESNKAITSNLAALGSAVGKGIESGVFNKSPKLPKVTENIMV